MDDLDLRPARAEDAAELNAIMHSSAAYRGRYALILVGCAVTPAYLTTHPTVVAFAGGRIVGFYSLIPDPPELDLMFVVDDAQGNGIGRRLIEHLLDTAAREGLRTIRVVSHPPSEGFYRALGARRVGTVGSVQPAVTWTRPELIFDV